MHTPTKVCTKCNVEKPLDQFSPDKKMQSGRYSWCRTCAYANHRAWYARNKPTQAQSKEWRIANREKIAAKERKYQLNLQAKAIAAYGGQCSCCEENRHGLLTLEHSNHDGQAHREKTGGNYAAIRDLKRRGWPQNEGLTIFCWNCQMSTRFKRPCPHQISKNPDIAVPPVPASTKRKGKLKLRLIMEYGGCCSCCGEKHPDFLTLEHTWRDGKEHRKKCVGSYGAWADLRDRNWPKDEGHTIFCYNCQMASRFGQTCPHKNLGGGGPK